MNYYLLLLSIILIIIIYFFKYIHNISFNIYNKDIEKTTILPINNYEIDEHLIEYLTSHNLTKELNYLDETEMYHLLGKINISAINKIHIQDQISKIIHTEFLFDKFHYLDNIEHKIYDNSDNLKKTSCDIIDSNTFNNGFKIINTIISLFNILFVHSNPCYYLMHLEKLFDRYSVFYRYINKNKIIKIGGIETVFISNHHQATEWVYKKFKGNYIPTILHIDTHPDEEGVYNPEDLKYIKKNIHNQNTLTNFYKNNIRFNIGCVIMPMIIPYEKNNGVIWVRPKWCIKDIKTNYFNKINYIETDDGNCTSIDEIDNDNNIDKCYKKYVTYINDIDINLVPSNFILNIDLDYFVSYGDEYCYADPISHNRTNIDMYLIHRNSGYFNKKSNELNNEINLIRKRIDHFLIFLKNLREQNKKPTFIILCNSSTNNHYFLEPWENNDEYKEAVGIIDIDNEYTPKYLSVWLHNTILMHLKLIYEN